MKLWVDDFRGAPAGWAWAKTYDEALEALESGAVEQISLDHDLACFNADGEEKTGYDVAKFIAELAFKGQPHPLMWSVHSANPVGIANIRALLSSYVGPEHKD
jgi:hypothetical protein